MQKNILIGIIIFAAVNTVFVIVLLFWLGPVVQNVRQAGADIAWQENQYTIHRRHYLTYEENVRELARIIAERRLLNSYEVAETVSHIRQIALENELSILQLTVGEPVTTGAYVLDQITITHIHMENEGYETDMKIFLQEITATHITVYRLEIVWHQSSRARISMEIRIFSA